MRAAMARRLRRMVPPSYPLVMGLGTRSRRKLDTPIPSVDSRPVVSAITATTRVETFNRHFAREPGLHTES